MKGTAMTDTSAELNLNGKSVNLPIRKGSVGPEVIDIALMVKSRRAASSRQSSVNATTA